jgi:hypothetical protein
MRRRARLLERLEITPLGPPPWLAWPISVALFAVVLWFAWRHELAGALVFGALAIAVGAAAVRWPGE